MNKFQRFHKGQQVLVQGWAGAAVQGEIADVDWIYHPRLEMHTWGYAVKFAPGVHNPFAFHFIPEGYIREAHPLWYLAGPYSSKLPDVIDERMQQFLLADYKLLRAGWRTVSPLSKHFCLEMGEEPIDGTYNFFGEYSRQLVLKCEGIIVLTIDGWKESTGVTDEITFGEEHNKKVIYWNPSEEPPVRR